MTRTLIFVSRSSALARWQTQWVMQALSRAWPELDCQMVTMTTQGDRRLDLPLPEIGGKGVFTEELEAALLADQVQAAVHSLKDLPIDSSPNLAIGAVPIRGEVRDVLVSARGYTLDTLPAGACVGTSSLRHAAQVLALRPDLRVESLRGNVETRLRKAQTEQYDAIVLAGAGLERLELTGAVSQWLPLDLMLPAPGQGALAVQCCCADTEVLRYLAAIDDPATRLATTAERAFLCGLGGGCSLPVGAYAVWQAGRLTLRGLVASPDGRRVVRVAGEGTDPQTLGADLAREAQAQLASIGHRLDGH